ncbi:hypothetical protein PHLCEN_2v1492 [Hermanssonia centrifuga]|uniref:Elongation Factor G domain-containing protein n=1 Tax=Hermanssonia centrifuga TaxID=98765 RepID=A0A2R6RZV3_9APHY|nr:hypothetical protein PHLCEN_2v1492 [Hermanssonia centrifuga]
MDYVGALLPSPVDVIEKVPSAKAPLRVLAWKVFWDKWMTFVRVSSVTRKSVIMNATRNHKERVSKLLLLYANQTEEVETRSFGSVGVQILGLLHIRTGDTLMSTKRSEDDNNFRDIVPPPVMSASVLPQSHSDLGPVQEALNSLSRTDPSVRIELQEGQILVHGLGALHLEIVESRLRDEWNVNIEFGKRMVSYREGSGPGNIDPKPGSWKTEMFGKPFTIDVDLDVRAFKEGEKETPCGMGTSSSVRVEDPFPCQTLSPTRMILWLASLEASLTLYRALRIQLSPYQTSISK